VSKEAGMKKKHCCQLSSFSATVQPMLPLKVRKCAEAPDHLRNEISSRALATSGATRGLIQEGKA